MPINKSKLLSQVTLFSTFPKKTIEKVSQYAQFSRYRRGEQIFSEHTAGDCLYVLVSGRVRIYASQGTRSKTFALLDPGDFFGEMVLLGESNRSASARAILDSELLIVQRKDFHQILKSDANLSSLILKTLCDRLRQADKQIEMLSFQNVVGRTAITLVELEAKYGKKISTGILIDADITHQELADLIGTAREMVSRALSRFRTIGAIRQDRSGKIVVANREKLKNCIYQ